MCDSQCCQQCAWRSNFNFYHQYLRYHSQMTQWLQQLDQYLSAYPLQNYQNHRCHCCCCCCCCCHNHCTSRYEATLLSKCHSSSIAKSYANNHSHHCDFQPNQYTSLAKKEVVTTSLPSRRHYASQVYPKYTDQVLHNDPIESEEYDDSSESEEQVDLSESEEHDPGESEEHDPSESEEHNDPSDSEKHDDPSKSEEQDYPSKSEEQDYPSKSEEQDYPSKSKEHDDPNESKKHDDPIESEESDDTSDSEDEDEDSPGYKFGMRTQGRRYYRNEDSPGYNFDMRTQGRRYYRKRYYPRKETSYVAYDDYGTLQRRSGTPPKCNVAKDLKKERKYREKLYGDKEKHIECLETTMTVKYDDFHDLNEIQLWPLRPINW